MVNTTLAKDGHRDHITTSPKTCFPQQLQVHCLTILVEITFFVLSLSNEGTKFAVWKALTFLDLQLDMVWQNQLKQFLEML